MIFVFVDEETGSVHVGSDDPQELITYSDEIKQILQEYSEEDE